MGAQSIDSIQKFLADNVFGYTQDGKKAAGRALGTFVEIVTYYTLKSWGLRDCVAIERRLPEYANNDITHNVEYSVHPILRAEDHELVGVALPITASKIRQLIWGRVGNPAVETRHGQLFETKGVLRNACVIGESSLGPWIAHLNEYTPLEGRCNYSVVLLHRHPYAFFECKRVGVEEGMNKGPQTIEKAKQGAYVARTVSSLQKFRRRDGSVDGVIENADGTVNRGPYAEMLRSIIESDSREYLARFTMSVGVVSNHGNWFTAENHSKELKVLAQSYDWLLFLTDEGLSDFVGELLLTPSPELTDVRKAFLASYTGSKLQNRFTKVRMDARSDEILHSSFR